MKLEKQLNVFDLTIIIVSLVIGMGIFRTPENVARAARSETLFFAAWIVGGAIAICGALTYAEIGSRMPVTGGYYKIFAYAYHPSVAFAVNCIILVSNAASLGAVALIGGEYITGVFIPVSLNAAWIADPVHAHHIENIQIVIAISAIILFYLVNLLGLKMSAWTQNVLTVLKILMVLLLISPVFFAGKPLLPGISGSPTGRIGFMDSMKAFGITLVAVCFTYGGYQQTINFGEEVAKPKKTIPRAIFSGIMIIVLLYLMINFAYVKVIGFNQLKSSKNIAAILASKVFGVNAERILSILLFLSVLAYVNVLMMSNPRVMAAMSEDKILPPLFRKRNAKTQALTGSLTVFSAICVLIIFWAKEFDTILSFTIFLDSFGMALSAGSIFIIRKKTFYLNGSGIFMMKYYPALPVIFIAAYIFVGITILITATKISLIGLGILTVFVVIYYLIYLLQMGKKHL
jgi:APA family basic amino acid/polyamine antiporter